MERTEIMRSSRSLWLRILLYILLILKTVPAISLAQQVVCLDTLEENTMTIRQGQSTIARWIEDAMRSSNVKSGQNRLADFVNKRNKEVPARPLNSMYLLFDIEVDDSYGHNVWNIEPIKDMSDKLVIYLHGGSYKYNFVTPHWLFITEIINQSGARVVAPDYPLAPKYNATHVFDLMLKVYKELINSVDPKNIIIMGDSAGGGMTLALAQLLKEKGLPQPGQLIMLSPCVDVTLSNPDIVEVDEDDPLLNIDSIIQAGIDYAGPLDRKNYLVSPIYGDLMGLAPMSCYVGTHDLLVADCRRLNCMATSLGIDFDYHEYEGLFHVGMLYPTPEASEIRQEIINEIKE